MARSRRRREQDTADATRCYYDLIQREIYINCRSSVWLAREIGCDPRTINRDLQRADRESPGPSEDEIHAGL